MTHQKIIASRPTRREIESQIIFSFSKRGSKGKEIEKTDGKNKKQITRW